MGIGPVRAMVMIMLGPVMVWVMAVYMPKATVMAVTIVMVMAMPPAVMKAVAMPTAAAVMGTV